jgi:REP element-mobilizing transposase RayT
MAKNADEPLGYYKRFLPHRDIGGMLQFITYRLADSLPAEALDKIAAELKMIPPDRLETERRKRMEDWLDAGYGCCALRHPEAAQYVIRAWQHFDGDRYDLLTWVVMPNHVHVLIRIYPGMMLGKIVQSWKSFTGRRIRKFMNGQAQANQEDGVWMREYWDRAIRDEKHFWITVKYIQGNPVKAGLAKSKEEWPWSSVSHHPELG